MRAHEPVAHSPRGGIPAQPYCLHIERVVDHAVQNAENAARFHSGNREEFVETVRASAIYHDLGKLDQRNQEVLRVESRQPLPIRHEDAGVAALLPPGGLNRRDSAILVAAHHAGLFSQQTEQAKRSRVLRFPDAANHVDSRLADYLADHARAGCDLLGEYDRPIGRCGFSRRLALSCLVDADHGDTAENYEREARIEPPPPRWAERIEALDGYVACLAKKALTEATTNSERERIRLRVKVYDNCQHAEPTPSVRSCDAAVGSGKTTAVMSHLLRVARDKGLRHIIVVLPYVNIIKESVNVYRDALRLEGEDEKQVVGAHHHQADFSEIGLRQLATLWQSPIVVTTAVQFFESIGSNHPSRLRKLHELAGSAVFVDEAHAAMPSHLWPQMLKWLETWTQHWGGHLVLASGSLPLFWELREYCNPPKARDAFPNLVSAEVRRDLERAETRRITPKRGDAALSSQELIDLVAKEPGPRLVIVNTVQTAAVIASRMRLSGHDVSHLSTALAPIDRDPIIDKIKMRLADKSDCDWSLVATSCVEAGMNFSFRTGFRESAGTASFIQVGGRVSRGGEYSDAAVWDFRLLHDSETTDNPNLVVAQRVLDALFSRIGVDRATDVAKEAMRREQTEGGILRAAALCDAEGTMEYPTVAELCRVIDEQTVLVLTNPTLADAIERGGKIDRVDVVQNSVRIWANKVAQKRLPTRIVRGDANDRDALYVWIAEYEPDFLGYMAGVLPLLASLRTGLFLA